jgi:hypothetical protein
MTNYRYTFYSNIGLFTARVEGYDAENCKSFLATKNMARIGLEGLSPATCYSVWAEVALTAAMTVPGNFSTNKQLICTVPARPPAILSSVLVDGLLR